MIVLTFGRDAGLVYLFVCKTGQRLYEIIRCFKFYHLDEIVKERFFLDKQSPG